MSMCAFVSRCVYVHALNVHARNAHLPLKRGVCWDTVRVRPLHLSQYNIHAFSGSTSLSGTALSHYKFLSFSAYIHACLESELSVSRGNIFRHLTALRGVFTLRLKINSSAAVNFKVKRSKKRLTFWEMNHFFFSGQEFEEKIETILMSFHSEYSYSEHLVSLSYLSIKTENNGKWIGLKMLLLYF